MDTPEDSVTTDDESVITESGNTEDVFPRSYVQELRDENARYRQRAQRADDLAQEVFYLRTAALGKLADPSDLPFSPGLLDDLPALEQAVDDLVATKPHLAVRRPFGDVGQGVSGAAGIDLAGLLRKAAG
ncbi:hypothetical protein AADG42_06580 [Ammonicoccus fulvus]|uniref:Nucleotide exchange factor GrpE n=1 Tax=Ammonicoccus fulvus TaxID=3138240 RepID=A0ABZ3FQF3_9ACTN